MALPLVVAVAPASAAARGGIEPGDEILELNGRRPRDVIEWQLAVDEPEVELLVQRGGLQLDLRVEKGAGEPFGVEVDTALFDQVRTCDNHCDFCFIYQLPAGLRESLYVKDDDYRLSFLYGNFTTLTRFTEADLERVVCERLGPLYVSIHATDPDVRAAMLRNRRGATSLRWLRALLDHGVEVHGQVVVCPGVNDGEVLEDTLTGILDEYPDLATVCVVPLGVSRHSSNSSLRVHTTDEAAAVVDLVEAWQSVFVATVGRRLAFAADEYYVLAGRTFPESDAYEGFPQHENGVGMARTFADELLGLTSEPTGPRSGFFAWVEGAPADGYRARRAELAVSDTAGSRGATAIVTGEYGAAVLSPLVARLGIPGVRVVPVANQFFGGNIAVTGLLVGQDVARTLAGEPTNDRYLLPDVCLSKGAFLDGRRLGDLPRNVEVVATDGVSLRRALGLG
jgi:putative radical SAM enzyme (TIGR03279 family)